MSRTIRVPLFPLAGAILFPRSQLPLHIFEQRYRDMVKDAIDGGGRIAMIQPQLIDDGHDTALFTVGCVGDIVSVEELEDGRFNIVLLGTNRFQMAEELDVGASYRCAEILIDTFDDGEPEALSLVHRAEVEQEARRLGEALGLAVDWAAVSKLDDETLVNAIAQVAPFDIGAKQALIEARSFAERTDLLVQLMQFHRAAVAGGNEIEPTLQ
ncbi:MAG: LON peptidase substrate-binding domain-containing protein [Sphingomicrobium sp.]